MTEPLALVCYEKLLPGSQVANRLQDLAYRVRVLGDPGLLQAVADQTGPMIILTDLSFIRGDACGAIKALKTQTSTCHIPVLCFIGVPDEALQNSAREAGAALVASGQAILAQLPQLLNQAIEVNETT